MFERLVKPRPIVDGKNSSFRLSQREKSRSEPRLRNLEHFFYCF